VFYETLEAILRLKLKGKTFAVYSHNRESRNESITCFKCGLTSWSQGDLDHMFCVKCDLWHDRNDVTVFNNVPPVLITSLLGGNKG